MTFLPKKNKLRYPADFPHNLNGKHFNLIRVRNLFLKLVTRCRPWAIILVETRDTAARDCPTNKI